MNTVNPQKLCLCVNSLCMKHVHMRVCGVLYVYCVHFQETDLAPGKTPPLMSDPTLSLLCKTQLNSATSHTYAAASVTYPHIAGLLSTLKPKRGKGLRELSQQT